MDQMYAVLGGIVCRPFPERGVAARFQPSVQECGPPHMRGPQPTETRYQGLGIKSDTLGSR